jgi:hypothetical protein
MPPVLGCQASEVRVVVQPAAQMRVVVQQPAQIRAALSVGQGPAGPSGAGLASYTHTQAAPSAVWTVNHDLNRQPSAVSLRTVGGAEFEGEWVVTSLNQLVVTLASPQTGTAHVI